MARANLKATLLQRAAPAEIDWRLLTAHVRAHPATPLDVLLAAMRDAWNEAERYRMGSESAEVIGDYNTADKYDAQKMASIALAAEYAARAAPYVHPRLTNMRTHIDTSRPLVIELAKMLAGPEGNV